MKKILSLLILLAIALPCIAQNYFFPTEQGMELTYKYYDRKGKEIKNKKRGPKWTKFIVENVWPGVNDNKVINVRIEDEELAGLDLGKYEQAYIDALYYGDVKIESDSVIFDNIYQLLQMEIPADASDSDSDMEVDIKAIYMLPRQLLIGMEFPDQEVLCVTIKPKADFLDKAYTALRANFGNAGGIETLSYTLTKIRKNDMINRKVTLKENVKTPAGTFECYKITYNLVEKAHDNTIRVIYEKSTPYAEWISPEIGLVKKERYTNRGKTDETILLFLISKNPSE